MGNLVERKMITLKSDPFLIILATIIAIWFAFSVSASAYVTTGVMFVGPAAVILACHLGLDMLVYHSAVCASRIFMRSFASSLLLLAIPIFLLLALPEHAHADTSGIQISNFFAQLGVAIYCTIIAAIVIGVPLGAIWLLWQAFRSLKRYYFPATLEKKDENTTINEFGSVFMALAILVGLSLEGLSQAYNFNQDESVSAQIDISAAPEFVWKAIGNASPPNVDLPFWLAMLPHPDSVAKDEGSTPGASRVIRFAGREGAGNMTMVARAVNSDSQTWDVVSDSTPLAHWAQLQSVSYTVTSAPAGSSLVVTGRFKRVLSPAWFFKPYMRIVVTSAMQVLAQDKHDRAMLVAAR